MKTKLFVLTLFAVLFLAGIVSASFTATLDGSFSKTDNTVIMTVTSTIADTVNVGIIPAITDGTNTLTVTANPVSLVFAGAGSKTLNLTYTGDTSNFALGTFSVLVPLTGTSETRNTTLSFVNSFCSNGIIKKYEPTPGEIYELKESGLIDNIDVTGFGPEDNTWYVSDDIEIELSLDNTGTEDIDDIKIEACLYDEENDECIIDEDDMELDDNFKLKDGDEISQIIKYHVNANDIDAAGDYVLYVKAYSDDLEEENLCIDDSEAITITEDEFVLLDDVSIPESASCGETITITADVWNVDSSRQDEVSVKVVNKELGIDQTIDAGDIDDWDKSDISFDLEIPKDADEKSYALKFTVLDENGDVYETDEDNEESVFSYPLNVALNCKETQVLKSLDISAVLETDEVKAGQNVEIKATLKNTGDETTSYSIGVDGYETFSTIESITPSTLTLDSGESGDVFITLKLDEDASGEQVFNIKGLFSGKEVTQPVSLTIQSGTSITGSAVGASFKQNWFIWLIVLINIILIVAIIIVAARMSRA